MKKLSIRLKITLFFTLILIVTVGITYIVFLSVSRSTLLSSVKSNLIGSVENTVADITYIPKEDILKYKNSRYLYLEYSNGYLEINGDLLDTVNGISLYIATKDGGLLYGESPIFEYVSQKKLIDKNLGTIEVFKTPWLYYDKKITALNEDTIFVRGSVSTDTVLAQLKATTLLSFFLLPALIIFSVIGGYIISGKVLSPIKKITETALRIQNGSDLKERILIDNIGDELQELSETFNNMFNRLDEAFEAEQRFTSDASHELRTPMSVIMAQCEYTLERPRSVEEYSECLEVIERQGRKMSRLISDILTYSRIKQKSENYQMSKVNLSLIVSSVCEDLSYLKEKNIVINEAIEDSIGIIGNSDLLLRLVTNLVSNAIKYGRENGYVNVSLKGENEKVILSVEDNGIGISNEDIGRLFNRFYQADPSRSTGGTGLGLSIAREIAQLHGGEILVTSELGIGSSFIVEFPKRL